MDGRVFPQISLSSADGIRAGKFPFPMILPSLILPNFFVPRKAAAPSGRRCAALPLAD
jgi:hypothetical protein